VKRWLRLVVPVVVMAGVLVLGGCGIVGKPALARQPLELTILHTGQVYGDLLPCG
jgi:hypothetical protein